MDPTLMLPMEVPPDMNEWNGAPMIWMSAVAIGFLIVIPVLRIYGKQFLSRKGLALDDYLMGAGCILGIGYLCTMIVAYNYGGGHHFIAIPLEHLPIYSATVWAATPMFIISTCLIKLSLLAVYWTLSQPGTVFRRILIATGIFIIGMSLGLALAMMFACKPIAKGYNPLLPGKCMDMNPYYFAQAGLMTSTDIVVYVLPIPMILKLNLPMRQRLSVCALFALGALAVVAGIIKLAKMPKLLSSPDVPWNGTTPLVWLNVELVAAVLAGSGPALKIVIRHWLPSWGFSASTVDGSDKTPPISTMERQRKWLLARGVSGVLSEDETGLANDDERGGCLKLCGCRRGNEVKGELEMGVRE